MCVLRFEPSTSLNKCEPCESDGSCSILLQPDFMTDHVAASFVAYRPKHLLQDKAVIVGSAPRSSDNSDDSGNLHSLCHAQS